MARDTASNAQTTMVVVIGQIIKKSSIRQQGQRRSWSWSSALRSARCRRPRGRSRPRCPEGFLELEIWMTSSSSSA